MADVDISYKGSTIAEMSESSTKTLTTAGKYLEGDIIVTYDKPPTKTSSDMIVSGATVTAPAGYYPQNASATVASGTAGTPIAIKGAVSSNSITVTPSVTNTAGYISGGVITGTPITVSASELVSGNLSIIENGSNIDVTNYATVTVDVVGSSSGILVVDTADSHGGIIREITAVEISGSQTITQNGVYDVTNLRRIIVKVAGSSSIDEENPIIGTGALGLATIGGTDPAGANSIAGIGLTGEAIVGAGPAGQATVGSGTADQAIVG